MCVYRAPQVTLDLLQFENIAVRRVLNTDKDLVTKLGVTEFPSCYLYYPECNYTRLKVWVSVHFVPLSDKYSSIFSGHENRVCQVSKYKRLYGHND